MTNIWLYLHFPQLQLDCLLAQHSTSADIAMVVVNPSQMQVMQLNQIAYAVGICKGMSLGAAATLDSTLAVHPYQEIVEQDKLKEIADSLYSVTSDICFFAPTGLLLRAHTMLSLYGSLASYWLAIQQRLESLNITYHYATGTTPLAAKALALQKWDQVCEDHSKIQKQLSSSPLDFTELDKKTINKLERVGIRRLKQLIDVPLGDIAKRFSHQLAHYLGQLQGVLPHPVQFYHPAAEFQRYMELLYEITNTQTLIPSLRYLLKALEQFLKLRDQLAMQVIIDLHQRDSEILALNVGSPQGEYRASAWQRLIELQLETVSLNAPVFAITLCVSKTHLCVPDKADLFEAKRGDLSCLQLIAILQAKLGQQAVYSPAFCNSDIPEQANQSVRVLNTQSSDWHAHAMRPIFLFPQPVPLAFKVFIEQGPERIQTAWWSGHLIERDYFVARNPQGQWFWIFRTPEQHWFVHGVFS